MFFRRTRTMKQKILYPPTVNYALLYQRPNQILKALARNGYPCYFMNHQPGLQGEKRIYEIEELEENLYLVPGNYPMHRIGAEVYFWSYPPYRHWYEKLKSIKVKVFDAIDSPTGEFKSWLPEWRKSVDEADMVMAVSDILYNDVMDLNSNVVLVKNGVDYEHYQQKTRNPYRKLKAKGFDRKKPIVGFSGAIASWVDTELMYRSCREYPEFNFVIFGLEYNVRLVNKPKNLVFIGHKPYEELPMWMNHLDVCTIPFKDNLVTQSCNPLKFWEYMATGNPVVTSNLPETKYPGVYWAEDDDEYIGMIGEAMMDQANGNLDSDKRKQFAKENSWNERIKPLVKFLEEQE